MALTVGTFTWWGAFLGADAKCGDVVYIMIPSSWIIR